MIGLHQSIDVIESALLESLHLTLAFARPLFSLIANCPTANLKVSLGQRLYTTIIFPETSHAC